MKVFFLSRLLGLGFIEEALGASPGGQGSYQVLFSQFFNFFIFCALVFFLLKRLGNPWLKAEADKFLKLSKEAEDKEKLSQKSYKQVQENIKKIEDKILNIEHLVKEACKSFEGELQDMELRYQKTEKKRLKTEIWRLKNNAIVNLKTQLLAQVLERTKNNIGAHLKNKGTFVLPSSF